MAPAALQLLRSREVKGAQESGEQSLPRVRHVVKKSGAAHHLGKAGTAQPKKAGGWATRDANRR